MCVHISREDAYMSLNENPKRTYALFLAIAVINILVGVRGILEGTIIKDGVVTFSGINLLCALLFIILFIGIWSSCSKE